MSDFLISPLYRLLTFRWNYFIKITEEHVQWTCKENGDSCQFLNVKNSPEIITGFFWDKIILPREESKQLEILGIKKRLSRIYLSQLIEKICACHVKKFIPICQQIKASHISLESILNNRYARHSEIERWKKNNIALTEKIKRELSLEFLSKTDNEVITKFFSTFQQSHVIRDNENKKFISRELVKYQDFFDKVENNPLTDSQRLACIVNEDNNLVLAGAGSGKTSVIIAKAGYLIQAGLALPHEVLILAYGRKASQETDERIKEKLPNIDGVRTSTFHKMGLNLIGEITGKKPRVSKLQEDKAEFYKLTNRIITDLTVRDKSYNQRVIDYFVTYLIPYKDEFNYKVRGEYFKVLKENKIHSLKNKIALSNRNNGPVSLQKEQLKSFEEVVIADFLFINRVNYIYEHPYEINTASHDKMQYCPDFYLPDYGLYIEHFGINRNGETPPFVDHFTYTQGMEWKRKLHRKHETTLIETYSYEMREGTLIDQLSTKLEKRGVKLNPLTYPELLKLLSRIDADKNETRFNKLIVTFLDLFKQSGHSLETVRAEANTRPDKPRCHAFLDVFEPIYTRYNHELEKTGTVDFSDMIRKATSLVRAGKYKSKYKYILVDEFQDISAIRADFVKSLAANAEESILTCVGDDWQSIYRFSGADINYTKTFEKYFGYTKKVPLDKTFRFNDEINVFTSNFIMQNPAQIKKKISSNSSVQESAVTLVEYYQDIDRAIQCCVEDIQSTHPNPATIYILGRYSFSKPTFLQEMAKSYPAYNFIFDTVHASKGKEADFVIVVDVNDTQYGFPSKIVDEPLLDLVLPPVEPHEHAEERRLFYVAVTRSKHHAYILYDTEKPSEFIQEITAEKNAKKYKFNKLRTTGVKSKPPEFGKCPSCLTGKITMIVMPDGRFFFGCGYYPYCDFTPRICPACNKYPLIKNSSYYQCRNPECGYIAKPCPKCLDGILVERSGRYGDFMGCTNYSKSGCKYTEKIK